MKWSEADRRLYKERMGGRAFTVESIKAFVEPAFQWDPENAKERALTALAYNFIKGFRDEDGIRDAIAFNQAKNGEPVQMAFAFHGTCEDSSIIQRQIDYMEAKQSGMGKTITKLYARKEELETQGTIFDYMPDLRPQQSESQLNP